MGIMSIIKKNCRKCKNAELIFIRNLHGDEINIRNARSEWYCPKRKKFVFLNEYHSMGEYSDGYHTFNELYHHRALLTAALFNSNKEKCWKSLKHHDDTMYEGMFIVGIETPEGQATYHYDIDPYWNLFDVKTIEKAPEYDGHTPEDSINRIFKFINNRE